MGAILKQIIGSDPDHFEPTNIHFGLFDPNFFQNLNGLKKDEIRQSMAIQAVQNFTNWRIQTEFERKKANAHSS